MNDFQLPQLDFSKITPPPTSMISSRSRRSFDELKLKRVKMSDLHRDANYEDPQMLAKEKYEVIKEINLIKNQNSQLQTQLNQMQKDYDFELENQISFFKFHDDDPDAGDFLEKLYENTKEHNEAQKEVEQLDEQIEFLNSLFNRSVDYNIRIEYGLQRHLLAQYQEEIVKYQRQSETIFETLKSKEMIEKIEMSHSLTNETKEILEELRKQKEENQNLKGSINSFKKAPRIETLKSQVDSLTNKLQSLQFREQKYRKDLTDEKEKSEARKRAIEESNKQKQKKKKPLPSNVIRQIQEQHQNKQRRKYSNFQENNQNNSSKGIQNQLIQAIVQGDSSKLFQKTDNEDNNQEIPTESTTENNEENNEENEEINENNENEEKDNDNTENDNDNTENDDNNTENENDDNNTENDDNNTENDDNNTENDDNNTENDNDEKDEFITEEEEKVDENNNLFEITQNNQTINDDFI